MKLNLIQDFQTGIYDYNLMSSVFVGLQAFDSRPVGSAAKISFSAQEWCGHVYSQALIDPERIRLSSHSYFEGEGDQSLEIPVPARGLSEDLLWHWARGFAAPALNPGESIRLPLLRSLEDSRLRHRAMDWSEVELSREREARELEVPAGKFQCRLMRAQIKDRLSWSFWVEDAWPNRIIQWQSSDGHEAKLRGSERMKYWQLNGPGREKELEKIGLGRE